MRKYSAKYENGQLLNSTVKKIDFQNQETKNGKLKTVFYCESKTIENGRTCIQYGNSYIKVGDKFSAEGRLNEDGTFIVWSLHSHPRNENVV